MENDYHFRQEQWDQHHSRSEEVAPNHPSRERSCMPYNTQYNSEMENNVHYSQGQWDIYYSGSGKVLPNHMSRARPSVCYNTQYNGVVDPPIHTYHTQPLTSYIHRANPEIVHGRYQGPGTGASPTGPVVTNVSYPDDNPHVGLFNRPSESQGAWPCVMVLHSLALDRTQWYTKHGKSILTQKKSYDGLFTVSRMRKSGELAQSLDAVSKRIATSRIRDLAMYDH
ncbi:hypothetical protein BU17DRAFT_60341 [Hysterangium stoloniferum]|nr:hypothetical protein BU17DRAFT_60341 [Hysterangium stoloniferum]